MRTEAELDTVLAVSLFTATTRSVYFQDQSKRIQNRMILL